MQIQNFRFPGVLNSQELLVAEAIQARAWTMLSQNAGADGALSEDDRARLGGIVLRLMSGSSRSVGDLAAAAVEAFEAD